MISLGIVVEGKTEEDFVNLLLDPCLGMVGIETKPVLLDGNVTVEALAFNMAFLFRDCGRVTSLVDYYGFRDKGADGVDALEQRILTSVQTKLKDRPPDTSLIIPYVQMYEFEALLFSEPAVFVEELRLFSGTGDQLGAIRENFANPEEINDSPYTAPSKRIAKILPHYEKVKDGLRVAERIGLTTIRAQCPRFNQWVTHLESLGATAQ